MITAAGAGQDETALARKCSIAERVWQSSNKATIAAFSATAAPLGHHWICAQSPRELPQRMPLEKAAYEICHEADNRSALLNVPLHGLAQLLAHLYHNEASDHHDRRACE
jgi:maltose alpha-D-glucosyltransferase/alpha-amylase